MKNRYITLIGFAILAMSFELLACADWVQDVDPLTDEIEDLSLNNEKYVRFLLRGVQGAAAGQVDPDQFESGIPNMILSIANMSDEMYRTSPVGQASIDENLRWADYHRVRWLAEDLIKRIGSITITDTELKDEALWWGYMIAGVIRMYLGEHWGWDADGSTPGAVLSTETEWGDFMSEAELHADARTWLSEALKYDPGPTAGVGTGLADKIIHSFIARSYLYDGDYAQAKTHAEQGLERGDQPFQIQNISNPFWLSNLMYNWTGRGYIGVPWADFPSPLDDRFLKYVEADRKEGEILSNLEEDPDGISKSLRGPEGGDGERGAWDTVNPRDGLVNSVSGVENPNERLPLLEALNKWGYIEGETIFIQDYYENADDPLDVIRWQEMELILAEAALMPSSGSSNSYSGSIADALVHINNVRDWYGLDPLTEDDMLNYDNPWGGASSLNTEGTTGVQITGPKGLLIEERDKTLWLMGLRIIDLRRFKLWDRWPYYAIPNSEVDRNPNLKDKPRNTA